MSGYKKFILTINILTALFFTVLVFITLMPAADVGTVEASTETDIGTEEEKLPIESQELPLKLVALTFDDGPSAYTESLLDKLNNHGVTATFFVIGNNAERYPDTISRMGEEGFEIGIHTYSHQDLTSKNADDIQLEISKTMDVISNATGNIVPALLRPPYGNYNKSVQGICADNGLSLVLWSVDTLDWESRDVDSIINTAFYSTHSIQDGSIVLMHDLYETTVNAVDSLIEKLKEDGYTFVTVSQMLEIQRDGAIPGEAYFSGCK